MAKINKRLAAVGNGFRGSEAIGARRVRIEGNGYLGRALKNQPKNRAQKFGPVG